ncbi:MAG: electron transfer flavoprotein subunit beta/FixA family protein [Caldimicrobium sp.]
MRIILCIKGVPKPETVKVDPETHTLKRESAELILNPFDRSAIEMAARLKERYGAEVIVISMGPPNVVPLLKEAYGVCADRMILLSDRVFAGSDTLATSRVLAKAIKKLSPFELILMGLKSADGETAQVPPETAALLGIPSLINVKDIFFEKGKIVAVRETEYTLEEIEVSPPLIASIYPKLDYLRPPSFKRLLEVRNKEPEILTSKDLGLKEEELGLSGSPTRVSGVFEKKFVERGEIWEGDPEELAKRLIILLKEKGFLKA